MPIKICPHRFISKCGKLYSSVFMVVALTGFLIIVINQFNILLDLYSSSSIMFFAGVNQCFLFCYFGEIVKSASLSCSRALYTTKWYQLRSIRDRKMFLFMLIQSQRNIGFKADGWIEVSLELFKDVSQIYYAILISAYAWIDSFRYQI
jgi:hypothetical protein